MSSPASAADAAHNFPRSRRLWPGLTLAIVGSIAFSGKSILAKLMYQHGVDAVLVITLRMLFSLPVFMAMAMWAGRGKAPLTARDWRQVSLLGFTGYFAASYFDFVGLQYIGVNLERMILYLSPTLVLMLGWVLFRRAITLRQTGAVLVGYLGVVVVFIHEAGHRNENLVLGAALVFASALCYAVYLIFSGEAVQRLGSLRLAGLATAIACVLTLITFALIRPMSALHAPAAVWWMSVLNALACTVAPVLMVMMAVERIGPALAVQAGMIGPLSTIGLSMLLLNEPFTPWLALGTALVLTGIWLLARFR